LKSVIGKQELASYVKNQLNMFFPDNRVLYESDLTKYLNDVMDRMHYCFKHIHRPYYNINDSLQFNHLHSDHYAMFLYIFSNTVWQIDKDENLASKLFLLNKALHGLDAFYSIELPEIFLFIHPLGTVLGKAQYSNYFAVYQNCTVGATEDNHYPTFSEETLLYSRSSVIGNCTIGKNVVFAANSILINTHVDHDKLVVGNYPFNKILDNHKNVIDRIFK